VGANNNPQCAPKLLHLPRWRLFVAFPILIALSSPGRPWLQANSSTKELLDASVCPHKTATGAMKMGKSEPAFILSLSN